MFTVQRVVVPLKIFLALLFGLLLIFQTLSFPGQFAHMAQESADFDALRWPATIVTVFWLLCVQVVIVATWSLLTMVKNDRIFSQDSMKWVDLILWAIAAAWLVLIVVLVLVGLNADDPGVVMMLLLLSIGVAVLGLLMLVMRALLHRATTLQTDMDSVI